MNFSKICILFYIIAIHFFSLNLCFSSDHNERKREQSSERESPPKKNKSSHQQESEHQEQKSETPDISTPDMSVVEKKLQEYKEILELCNKEDSIEINKKFFLFKEIFI